MGKLPAIGIDLGTTYSCVAVWQDGKVEVIADEQGNRTTPSYVAFDDTERMIGEPAKYQVARNPKNTIFDVKRLIGRKFNDPKIQDDINRWPFTVKNVNDKPMVQIEFKGQTKEFDPAEICAMLLSKLVKIAEKHLGGEVKDVVITVPAYFNDSQRQATKDAGVIAGLNVLRIINEPTAAALAFGLPKNLKDKKTVLIFDLGGGTFDVSIITIDKGSVFQVISTAGNTNLGGEDFDNRFVDYFVKEFKSKQNIDLTGNARALRRLRTACERAKCILSLITETPIEIDSLYEGIDFFTKATRTIFENVNKDQFDSLIEPVKQVITNAKIDKSSIDEVVLVGGSTRIPKIQKLLEDFFDGKTLNFTINPDEAVAYGAAMQAAKLTDEKSQLQHLDFEINDITPISIGIEIHQRFHPLFKCNAPTKVKQLKSLCHNQTIKKYNLYEHDRKKANFNLLGTFKLTGISLSPKVDAPNVEVTFELNADGVLHVSAKDIITGKSEPIPIRNDVGRLTKDEIDQMKLNAENYHAEDERQRQKISVRHKFEDYIVKCMKEVEDAEIEKLTELEKQAFRNKCILALDWLEDNITSEKEDIENYLQQIEQEYKTISTKLFKEDEQDLTQICDTLILHGPYEFYDDNTTQKTNSIKRHLTFSPEEDTKRQKSTETHFEEYVALKNESLDRSAVTEVSASINDKANVVNNVAARSQIIYTDGHQGQKISERLYFQGNAENSENDLIRSRVTEKENCEKQAIPDFVPNCKTIPHEMSLFDETITSPLAKAKVNYNENLENSEGDTTTGMPTFPNINAKVCLTANGIGVDDNSKRLIQKTISKQIDRSQMISTDQRQNIRKRNTFEGNQVNSENYTVRDKSNTTMSRTECIVVIDKENFVDLAMAGREDDLITKAGHQAGECHDFQDKAVNPEEHAIQNNSKTIKSSPKRLQTSALPKGKANFNKKLENVDADRTTEIAFVPNNNAKRNVNGVENDVSKQSVQKPISIDIDRSQMNRTGNNQREKTIQERFNTARSSMDRKYQAMPGCKTIVNESGELNVTKKLPLQKNKAKNQRKSKNVGAGNSSPSKIEPTLHLTVRSSHQRKNVHDKTVNPIKRAIPNQTYDSQTIKRKDKPNLTNCSNEGQNTDSKEKKRLCAIL